MPVSHELKNELTRLLQSGSPFFAYCLPGGELSLADTASVRFTPWPGCNSPAELWRESTSWPQYRAAIETLVERLKQRRGKTVMSRTICGSHNCDMVQLALDFFEAYPQTYRTIFYTPQTGAWMGASPELLYKIDGDRLYTMALAGTRLLSDGPWDEKNLEEHRMVADFIEDALAEQTQHYNRSELGTLRYGAIEHLLTEFTAETSQFDLERLKNALQPTPAVGGYPRREALDDIARLETHRRNLYSGLIEFDADKNSQRLCIVNLRCMQFDAEHYCIYAGGGITSQSDPAAEWAETEAKSAWLREHIK